MQKVKELFYKGVFDNKSEKEIYKQARGISKQELQKTIAQLLQANEIEYTSSNRLRVRFIAGKLQGNSRGFAFFIPENGGQDLFIKQENLNGAIHSDQVLVKKIGGKKGDEAVVVKIIKRNTTRIIGTYNYSKFGGKVTPDDRCYAQDVCIENVNYNEQAEQCTCQQAIQGEKVVVKITKQLENGKLYGYIERVLGFAGELTVEEESILESSQLPQEFTSNCLSYADRVASQKITADNRLDLRNALCITIDGDDSRDYDDAISITKEENGYILGVHIADVTHYVKRGDVLDIEAYERGTSVYLPDRVIPMLPKQLSNGACSLNEREDRYTLSCIMHIDNTGTVTKYKIANSIIRSKYRMTYRQVTKLLEIEGILDQQEILQNTTGIDGKALQAKYADIVPMCVDFAHLTRLLIAKRKGRGSIDLDIEESQITVQNDKIDIVKYERTFAHKMIEEAMILANETVAQFVEEKGLPFVYRVHEQPPVEKANHFLTFLHSMGIAANFDIEDVKPQQYANILKGLHGNSLQPVVHRVLLRSMSKARYCHTNCGHFGLASASYAHFTSPIRRYPDLLIHRIIKHILNAELNEIKTFKTFVEKASVQCSLRERRAEECERNVDELYKVFYMQQFIGQTFTGTISGVTNFAIFVELENSIEGHIKIENLPKDSYRFIEEKALLKGDVNQFALGDSIQVKLMRCDIAARKIELLPLGVEPFITNREEKAYNKVAQKRNMSAKKRESKDWQKEKKQTGENFAKKFKGDRQGKFKKTGGGKFSKKYKSSATRGKS